MGVFLKHEPCPKCGSRDNLGRYADGSAWCFGCHYRERADRIPIVDQKFLEKDDDVIQLDDDLCFDYPGHVVSWLGKYGIAPEEGIKHGWKYSPKRDQLVFIFKDADGNISCTQARNFRQGSKTKYYNQGSPAEVLPIFSSPRMAGQDEQIGLGGRRAPPKRLVVVEDAVSAAKIARQRDAMPCLGSYLPKAKLIALRGSYDLLALWLDADKLREAREIADQAKWIGFETRVIYTELDPKEYSDEDIWQLLN